jgi:hypothetical protein
MRNMSKGLIAMSLVACLAIIFSQDGSSYSRGSVLACSQSVGQTQWTYDCQIGIFPATPTQDETFTILVSSTEQCACLPTYSSHQVTDDAISIFFEHPELCLMVHCPVAWEYALDVGPLPSGWYEIAAHFDNWPCPSRMLFVFSEQPFEIYLPIVARSESD